MSLYEHVLHPHIEARKHNNPVTSNDAAGLGQGSTISRFNSWLAVKISAGVGTMWCAYAFACLALISLPTAAKHTATLISWIAQTFLQLVLLSIIIVGQNIQSAASDKRALDTYNDAEAVLHTSLEIEKHLQAQDEFLQTLKLTA